MKANQGPRERTRRRAEQAPDGGQMLLLAGFLLAGTAIMAIGAFSMLQRTETQLTVQEHRSMLNLFLNTRERAITYFDIVSANDTAASVDSHLDGYLQGQFQTAQSLSLSMNATLAGGNKLSPDTEKDFLTDLDSDGTKEYATRSGQKLWDFDSKECYSAMEDDGDNDGLITDSSGDVIAAIFWLKVEGTDSSLEEYIVIDVPSTSGPGSC